MGLLTVDAERRTHTLNENHQIQSLVDLDRTLFMFECELTRRRWEEHPKLGEVRDMKSSWCCVLRGLINFWT